MQQDDLASLTREVPRRCVLIVSADAVRASRLARAVAQALGEGTDAIVLVRSTIATAHSASTSGLDLCLFDVGDGELDATGCISFLLRMRAKRMLVVSRAALTSLAIDAVRAGAFGYQPFDDGDGNELVAAAVRDALRDHDGAGLEGPLAELRPCAERGRSLLGDTIVSPAPLAVTEPGSGTSFEILLQRANETTGPDSVPASSTGTVLLVDDDDELRKTHAELLQAAGWRVLTGQDGFSALLAASAHSGPIHLLIAAVVLPQMSGIELWRKLSRFRPEMRVLFLSGNMQQARRLFGSDVDPPAMLVKPCGAEALVATVRDLLSTHPFMPVENREIA